MSSSVPVNLCFFLFFLYIFIVNLWNFLKIWILVIFSSFWGQSVSRLKLIPSPNLSGIQLPSTKTGDRWTVAFSVFPSESRGPNSRQWPLGVGGKRLISPKS